MTWTAAGGIVCRLSADFGEVVLVAIALALPLGYLCTSWWLDRFAYRIDLQWWYFTGAGVAALAIAWITVGVQSFRAAVLNPVVCLRDE